MAEQRPSTAKHEDLSQQMEQLRSDVAEISKTLGDLGRSQVTELRSRAEKGAAEMRDRARDVEHQAEDYIREHPLQSLAIAAGLGLLVGWLTRR